MRRKDREVTDPAQIRKILEQTMILHPGLFDEGYPYVVPLHYGFCFEDGALTFYMHGARAGHKIDLIQKDPRVCVELECDVELISGGEIPCSYGSTYSSVIARGKAELLTDSEEKVKGLECLMAHQTGRAFPIDPRMAAAVAVIKVTVDEFTAKARPAMMPQKTE